MRIILTLSIYVLILFTNSGAYAHNELKQMIVQVGNISTTFTLSKFRESCFYSQYGEYQHKDPPGRDSNPEYFIGKVFKSNTKLETGIIGKWSGSCHFSWKDKRYYYLLIDDNNHSLRCEVWIDCHSVGGVRLCKWDYASDSSDCKNQNFSIETGGKGNILLIK